MSSRKASCSSSVSSPTTFNPAPAARNDSEKSMKNPVCGGGTLRVMTAAHTFMCAIQSAGTL